MDRPIIGVTTGANPENPHEGGRTFYVPYAESAELAGGETIYLDPHPDADIAKIIASIDGLLLTGGKDVHPRYYAAHNEPGDSELSDEELIEAYGMDCDPDRDAFEIPLIKSAYEAGIPIFGVCRGLQVLNVALGGSLIKDIRTGRKHWPIRPSETDEGTMGDSRRHLITVMPHTRMAEILGECPIMVNSRHHQGISQAQKSDLLNTAAIGPDGIIEAVESTDHPWAVAVQWHPERIQDDFIYEPSRELFNRFISEAAKYGAARI